MTGRLILIGSVIVDLVLRVDALPEPGGDVVASESDLVAGGGLNALVAAGRDGARTVFAGRYGTGPFADVVQSALATSGTEIVQTADRELDSGYCVAIVDASGERTFVTSPGAEVRLGAAELARVRAEGDDIVLVSGYALAPPMDGAAIVKWLAALPPATRVVVDPSPLVADIPEAVLGPVLTRATVLSANAREARLLATRLGGDAAHPLPRLADGLAQALGGAVLVRDGAAGCWVVEPGAVQAGLVPGYLVDAVDTSGAGDAHAGVLIAALLRGDGLTEAVRRANAAAALSVTRRGPATAPNAAETDALLGRAEWGPRSDPMTR